MHFVFGISRNLFIFGTQMHSILTKIKRLIIQGNYLFTAKAEVERIADQMTQEDFLESAKRSIFGE
ncbi:MAG: hypothetical protein ACE5I1_18850 [bacterium]